ncbi:MAG TPA: TMEM14 family protein [Polyangiaceae bacterium]|nr:TMEM14 family protein [Polyangiaceae bacterium]
MLEATKVYLFLFGALTIAGGVLGYVKAKSRPSLVAGGISGGLLLVAGYLLGIGSATGGCLLGLVQSVALAVRFVPAFAKGRKFMPAGLIALLGVGGIALTALGLVVK